MLKSARSYEFLPAAWTGRRTEYVLGKHSGSALIRYLLSEAGLEFDDELVQELLQDVKHDTEQRDKAEHRRMHALKEAFALLSLSGIDPATVIARTRERRAERALRKVGG
jgi:isopropylmalate/homocitrate/citramalate synthase